MSKVIAKFIFSWLVVVLFYVQNAQAEIVVNEMFKVSGQARVQYLSLNNFFDFNQGTDDLSNYLLQRFRTEMTFTPSKSFTVFVQPQFYKQFGQMQYNPSVANVASPSRTQFQSTNGLFNDTFVGFHQGYLKLHTDYGEFTFGRQLLNYGTEFLLSSIDWKETGLSFDALKYNYKHSLGWFDIFATVLQENSNVPSSIKDSEMYGIYSSWNFGSWAETLDIYALYHNNLDPSSNVVGTPFNTLTTAGARIQAAPITDLDYRAEFAYQMSSAAGVKSRDEYGLEAEIGYTMPDLMKLRLAAKGFFASAKFNQLYSNLINIMNRPNMTGLGIIAKANPIGALRASLSFFKFMRTETDSPAMRIFNIPLAGTAGSTEKSVLSEFQASIGMPLYKDVILSGLYVLGLPDTFTTSRDLVNVFLLRLDANF